MQANTHHTAVVDLETARNNRKGIGAMHGASEQAMKDQQGDGLVNKHDTAEAAVNGWVQKVMLGAVSLLLTIFMAFFAWVIPAVNNISASTQLSQADQANTRSEIAKLLQANTAIKASVDDLTKNSLTWATKDQVADIKDKLRADIDQVEQRVNDLNLRMTKLEAEQPVRRR